MEKILLLERHNNISIRKPEATSPFRATNFNKKIFHDFFDNLHKCLTKYTFKPESTYILNMQLYKNQIKVLAV